jgi:hypothetical protein
MVFVIATIRLQQSPNRKSKLAGCTPQRVANISCGLPFKEFGSASFPAGRRPALQVSFNHSHRCLKNRPAEKARNYDQ